MRFQTGATGYFSTPQNLFRKIGEARIMFLTLGPDEGVEIVSIKAGFGSCAEVCRRMVPPFPKAVDTRLVRCGNHRVGPAHDVAIDERKVTVWR